MVSRSDSTNILSNTPYKWIENKVYRRGGDLLVLQPLLIAPKPHRLSKGGPTDADVHPCTRAEFKHLSTDILSVDRFAVGLDEQAIRAYVRNQDDLDWQESLDFDE